MKKLRIALCTCALAFLPISAFSDDGADVKVAPYQAPAGAANFAPAGNLGAKPDEWSEVVDTPAAAVSRGGETPPATVVRHPTVENAEVGLTSARVDTNKTAVATVNLPGSNGNRELDTFHVGPEDIDLRSAMEKWLQSQGWQLAWNVTDAMPVGFSATFTGKDMKEILWKVMKSTDHFGTPSRVCRHTNNVVRVVARSVSCKE